MFTEMITLLQQNIMPSPASLKGRLHIAIIKKEAILNLPKNFHVSDPKINPRADHMLWAAIILNDKELFDFTATLILTEKSMGSELGHDTAQHHADLITDNLAKLLAIPTTDKIRATLKRTIKKISAYNQLPK